MWQVEGLGLSDCVSFSYCILALSQALPDEKKLERGAFGPKSSLTQSPERQRNLATFFTRAFLL